ncbi:MAG TPA: quinol:electron acceptor oxidoreductase subunit ActD, partial [Planctomycetota bacterium]|nr:quinol:electron acceptor oxidoreductase subunit ActD [Planctomycetota bacterium]
MSAKTPPGPRFVIGEFEEPEAMRAALRGLRERGYRRLEAFSPYPVKGVEELCDEPRSS